jgi:cysteine desulfurase / selenocysteine lyase
VNKVVSTIQECFLWNNQPVSRLFPALQQKAYGKPLIYFDNAATTQKPAAVIDSISEYYRTINSNIHRGVHYLSQQATEAYELSRKSVAAFINATHNEEIIFTKGTTDSINLVATTFGRLAIEKGDVIIISAMEHHSNIVPWQIMCEERGATLKVIPMTRDGELIMEAYEKMLNDSVKIVAVNYISNSLGTVNPVKDIIRLAHEKNIPVLIDAAQAIQHLPVDVQELDCDFMAFSGHKMYGPTGIGILYGKEKWLNALPPYQGGGEMIKNVTFEKTTFNELPFKFEAGTPHIEGAICLKAAVDFITQLDINKIAAFEHNLLDYATEKISAVHGINIIGNAKEKSGAISFLVEGAHPYDVGVLLDKMGIAVRTGHHCTQPVMDYYGIPGTVRASFAVYNTTTEIDQFIHCLERVISMLN